MNPGRGAGRGIVSTPCSADNSAEPSPAATPSTTALSIFSPSGQIKDEYDPCRPNDYEKIIADRERRKREAQEEAERQAMLKEQEEEMRVGGTGPGWRMQQLARQQQGVACRRTGCSEGCLTPQLAALQHCRLPALHLAVPTACTASSQPYQTTMLTRHMRKPHPYPTPTLLCPTPLPQARNEAALKAAAAIAARLASQAPPGALSEPPSPSPSAPAPSDEDRRKAALGLSGEEAFLRRGMLSRPPPSQPSGTTSTSGGLPGLSDYADDPPGPGAGLGAQPAGGMAGMAGAAAGAEGPKGMSLAEKMLKKMGWREGEGLGKHKQGIATPLVAQKVAAGAGVIVAASEMAPPEKRQRTGAVLQVGGGAWCCCVTCTVQELMHQAARCAALSALSCTCSCHRCVTQPWLTRLCVPPAPRRASPPV